MQRAEMRLQIAEDPEDLASPFLASQKIPAGIHEASVVPPRQSYVSDSLVGRRDARTDQADCGLPNVFLTDFDYDYVHGAVWKVGRMPNVRHFMPHVIELTSSPCSVPVFLAFKSSTKPRRQRGPMHPIYLQRGPLPLLLLRPITSLLYSGMAFSGEGSRQWSISSLSSNMLIQTHQLK